jgi:hypothetical protein
MKPADFAYRMPGRTTATYPSRDLRLALRRRQGLKLLTSDLWMGETACRNQFELEVVEFVVVHDLRAERREVRPGIQGLLLGEDEAEPVPLLDRDLRQLVSGPAGGEDRNQAVVHPDDFVGLDQILVQFPLPARGSVGKLSNAPRCGALARFG